MGMGAGVVRLMCLRHQGTKRWVGLQLKAQQNPLHASEALNWTIAVQHKILL